MWPTTPIVFSHKLNLASVKAYTAIGTLQKLISFFSFSPMRQRSLEKWIEEIQEVETDKVKLKQLSHLVG